MSGEEGTTPLPQPLLVRSDIPAIAAQSTDAGKFVTLGPLDADGNVLLKYGDWGANTGPMRILAVTETGQVITHLTDWDNEAVTDYHVATDGSIYSPCTDPKNNGVAQIAKYDAATEEWGFIPVSVAGLNEAEHMFGIASEGTTTIACGSHLPDTAFIWESTDDVTWTEVVGDVSGVADGYHRFYGFDRDDNGVLIATTTGPNATYKRIDGTWVEVAYEPVTLDYGLDKTQPYVNTGHYIVMPDGGGIGPLPTPAVGWSTTRAADGQRLWLCDGASIWLFTPAA